VVFLRKSQPIRNGTDPHHERTGGRKTLRKVNGKRWVVVCYQHDFSREVSHQRRPFAFTERAPRSLPTDGQFSW